MAEFSHPDDEFDEPDHSLTDEIYRALQEFRKEADENLSNRARVLLHKVFPLPSRGDQWETVLALEKEDLDLLMTALEWGIHHTKDANRQVDLISCMATFVPLPALQGTEWAARYKRWSAQTRAEQ